MPLHFSVGLVLVAAAASAVTNGTMAPLSSSSFSGVSSVILSSSVSSSSGVSSVALSSTISSTLILSVAPVSPPPTTFVTIGFTSTTTAFVTPLASSAAWKQQEAYRKAQGKANPVASEIKELLSMQGKVVPSALVPAQPKQTEIKHSGLENIVEIVNNTVYNLSVAATPEDGKFYITFFNGTDFDVADEFAKKHHARLPHTIVNPSQQGMCILGHAMNLKTNKVTPFAFEGTKIPQLYIGPNTTAQVGNFMPDGESGNNGRIQARFNCIKDCKKCAGDNYGPVATLVEYNHITKADGTIYSFFDASNVDGLHANFNLTVYNDNKVCRSRQCSVTAARLRTLCPLENTWYDKGTFGCKSDCKRTGRDDHCCVGAYSTPQTCPASSSFLHEICPDAYSWAYDDKDHTDTCDGTEKVHMSFWPIPYGN